MTENPKIEKISKNYKGITIQISGFEEPLIVSQDTIIRHKLVNEIILTPSQIEILKEESEFYLCNQQTARLLGMRSHSVGEIRQKLKIRKFSSDTIKKIIKKYTNQGVLDDTQYAYQLAKNILERKPCGKPYLVAHLQRKQIDRMIAENVVETVLNDHNQIDLAIASLGKKWLSFSKFELETARKKSYNYLSRRGFSYGIAREAFENLNSTNKEFDH